MRKDLWKHPYEKESDSPQAVLFVAYTNGSELAKRIRKAIQILKPFCNKLKVLYWFFLQSLVPTGAPKNFAGARRRDMGALNFK